MTETRGSARPLLGPAAPRRHKRVLRQEGTRVRFPEAGGGSLRLQAAVPLLALPPPLQVSGALQPVHARAQEDDDAAGHEHGGDPALRGRERT